MNPTRIDAGLLSADLRTTYAQQGWIPLERDDDVIVVGSSLPDSARRSARISALLDARVRIVPLSQGDIVDAVVDAFRAEFVEEAANALYHRDPGLSARYVLSRGQKIGGVIALLAVIGFAVVWPLQTLIVVIAIATST